MYIDENKSSALAKFLSDYDYAVIDTCSMMEEGFAPFMDNLVGARHYLDWKKRLIIPGECFEELKAHSKNQKEAGKRIDATRAIRIINDAKRFKVLTIAKKDRSAKWPGGEEQSKTFADPFILSKLNVMRFEAKLVMITQDKGLAEDIVNLKNQKSQYGHVVPVYKLESDGALVINKISLRNRTQTRPQEQTKTQQKPVKPANSQPNAGKTTQSKAPAATVEAPNEFASIVSMDTKLSCNIPNKNYPLDRKIADIREQLDAFKSLTEDKKKGLKLSYPETKLQSLLAKLSPTPAEKKPIKQQEKPQEAPKPIPAPNPHTAEVSKPQPAKVWRGEGKSLQDALSDSASHMSLLFRDPSLPFVKGIHGSIDLTTADLAKIVELLNSSMKDGTSSVEFKGLAIRAESKSKGFATWIEPQAQTQQEEPKKAETKASKPASKKQEAPKSEDKEQKKPQSKPKATKAAEPKKAEEKPAGEKQEGSKPSKEEKPSPTLIVAEPKPKASPKKKESAPKASPKKEGKQEEKKPEEKPAKPSKKPTKAEQAKKADTRLQAVLPNPKYAMEDKIADITSQIALLTGLKKEAREGLHYQTAELRKILKDLQGK